MKKTNPYYLYFLLPCLLFLFIGKSAIAEKAVTENIDSENINTENIDIEINIPKLNVGTYHRPYVAIWLETEKRKGLHTIAVWHEKEDWLKDMRQWWRKLGRKNTETYDATSSATRRPGSYHINWNALDKKGNAFPAGEYYLSFEAAREAGGRDYLRQKISLGHNKAQQYTLKGKVELGNIKISINRGTTHEH